LSEIHTVDDLFVAALIVRRFLPPQHSWWASFTLILSR